MVVGDVVNVVGTIFVPAVGVEIIVLFNFGGAVVMYWGFDDGATWVNQYRAITASIYSNSAIGTKFGITNTHYWRSTGLGFSGIQIK